MPKAMRIYEYGGPEAMRWEEVDPGEPGPGEALVRHEAVGVNFIDVYHRTGLYPLPALPAVLGLEGAGVVEAVGQGVDEVAVGDRVAYEGPPTGSYSESRTIPAQRLVRLPEAISFTQAASMMLKGMTARYLIRRCHPVKAGDVVLMHAAAGGVGSIVCQWASGLGAVVIGTVGSEEKAELARSNGCAHPILYREEDFVARVREITDGRGVDAVYDSVGQATFLRSLDCLRPFGMMVTFGQSSGSVEPFNPGLLAAKGSLFLTRPSLIEYTRGRADLLEHAADLFDAVERGLVRIQAARSYPLAEAARAHQDLEGRRTTGSSVMIP